MSPELAMKDSWLVDDLFLLKLVGSFTDTEIAPLQERMPLRSMGCHKISRIPF
jgi:hypothetical protein